MRSLKVLLVAIVLALAAANIAETLRRSAVPLGFDGIVTNEEVFFEKHRGVDDVHLVTVDGRTVHLDAAVAQRIRVGDSVVKDPWSRTLVVNENEIRLEVSRDFRGMLVVMPVVVLMMLLILAPRKLDVPEVRRAPEERRSE